MATETKTLQIRNESVSVVMNRPSYGRPGADVDFTVTSSFDITREELKEIQETMGFHPMGYGFGSATVKQNEKEGIYVTTWKCSSTCD